MGVQVWRWWNIFRVNVGKKNKGDDGKACGGVMEPEVARCGG